jgi:hypothetical protein
MERGHEFTFAGGLRGDPKITKDELKQLDRIKPGMENIGAGVLVIGEPTKKLIQDGSLSRAGFPREKKKPLARVNAIEELRQSGIVNRGGEIKARIRGDVKGVFAQTKKGENLAERAGSSSHKALWGGG